MVIAYDGSSFQGFQKQTNARTVEKSLSDSFMIIHKKPVKIIASGRTDRGVHALYQVCHFDSDLDITPASLKRAINARLPKDIRILELHQVSDDFHARFSAIKKTYQYVITTEYNLFDRNKETYIHYPLDVGLMKEAIKNFIGTHDFKGFASYVKKKPTVREIYEAKLETKDHHIIITFTGNGFLQYMVRRMVGVLIEIGRGKENISIIDEIFIKKDNSICGKTANPEGLYLKHVYYEGDL